MSTRTHTYRQNELKRKLNTKKGRIEERDRSRRGSEPKNRGKRPGVEIETKNANGGRREKEG